MMVMPVQSIDRDGADDGPTASDVEMSNADDDNLVHCQTNHSGVHLDHMDVLY